MSHGKDISGMPSNSVTFQDTPTERVFGNAAWWAKRLKRAFCEAGADRFRKSLTDRTIQQHDKGDNP